MQTKFSGLEFSLFFFIIIHYIVHHKNVSQPFSLLTWPTELKLFHRVGIMLNDEYHNSCVEADMTTTQRKEGPLDEMGRMAQRRFGYLRIVTIAMEFKGGSVV